MAEPVKIKSMKRFIPLWVLLLIFIGCSRNLVLVENHQSSYRIITAENASAAEKRAAALLQQYLEKISGARLPVVTDNQKEEPHEIIIGMTNRSRKAEFAVQIQSLQEDGFWIKTQGSKLIILGGRGKGIIYGVTGFLEDYLGCRKYSPAVEKVPAEKNIIIGSIDDKQVPPAGIRIVHGKLCDDEDYKDWRKLNVVGDKWGSGTFRGYYVHTFTKLVPADTYFKNHPEYFSMRNGQRIHYGQLCLTNPDVLQITIDNLRKVIRENPQIKYWSVSQNDNYYYCQCPNCAAVDEQEGSHSGSLIRFVNKVAEAFPDKCITTLAYQYTRKPPAITKPAENVMITLCTIELNRGEPIATDPTCADFRQELRGWGKITDKIMIWDYEIQFTNYLCPFPLFHTLQPNIQLFTGNHTIGHFQQCNASSGLEFSELKSYLISKLLWNPDADTDPIIDDFMHGYYGRAAKYVRQYFDLLHEEGKKSGQRLDIYGTPVWHAGTYLSAENIQKYKNIFAIAQAQVPTSPEVLERVKIARLPVQFAELEIAKTDLFGARGWYSLEGSEYKIKAPMRQMLERFTAVCKKNGIQYLNEKGLSVDDYYRNTLRFIDVQVEGNKAFKKSVVCMPLPAEKYSCSGPPTLTNGVRGTEDYKINWLGWEGVDVDITLDLGQPCRISRIEISTLQTAKSWIIHPLEIGCSLSMDGKTFVSFRTLTTNKDQRSEPDIKTFAFTTPATECRFIRFKVTGTKKLPRWHPYKGNKSWVFIDEITVK